MATKEPRRLQKEVTATIRNLGWYPRQRKEKVRRNKTNRVIGVTNEPECLAHGAREAPSPRLSGTVSPYAQHVL